MQRSSQGQFREDGHPEAELRAAYDRGRRDEYYRRRSSPLVALTSICIGLAGAAILALAAYKGSFAEGGTVVDRQISAVIHGDKGRRGENDQVAAQDNGNWNFNSKAAAQSAPRPQLRMSADRP